MIHGLIPAAGKSTRMGRPKLSLSLGNRTVLEHVLGALRAGGVDRTLVVIGPHVAELAALAQTAGADVCVLAAETPDMRATVEHGLAWLEQRRAPSPSDSVLLVPADHPTLDAGVIRVLIEKHREMPAKSIFVPTYAGRRGHPTLIGWPHVADIRKLPRDVGLNAYLRNCPGDTFEVAVESADILRDLDTPQEYEELRRRWADRA